MLDGAGTGLLLVGELASIPIVTGRATLRAGVWHGWRRFTPLATGIWLTALTAISLAAPKVLHGGVGLYGVCLLAMARALYTHPAPSIAATAGQVQLQRA